MFAVVTFAGVASILILCLLLVLMVIAFGYWINVGGFIGWWMATDLAHCMGKVFEAIIVGICSTWGE